MAELALDLQGEYVFYEQFYEDHERWAPVMRDRGLSPWVLGQMVFDEHSSGRFRALAAEESVLAGSSVRLRIEGITPFAALAVVSGRLDGPPPEAFGKILLPLETSLDVLAHIPKDAAGGTYIFFGEQWEPFGQPAYPGGSLIYPSSVASVKVRPHTDDEAFWNSFEAWPEDDAEVVRQNVRRMRAGG